MQDYPIALWSLHLGCAPRSVGEFADQIEAGIRRANAAGARLLMLPEYAIQACLAFKPDGLKPTQEMPFLAEVGENLLQLVKDLPAKYGISLLAGSLPVCTANGITNTAVLLTPDGREIRQDKLCLTPGEQDPESWMLTPGSELRPFELDGLKMAILICLDVEMPALSCLLAPLDLDLLLVPSMTEKRSGYRRVFGCAKARAVELMCAVGVCGSVGECTGGTPGETNVSGAALYVPCEESLGFDGVVDEIPPTSGDDAEEPFLVANVPLGKLRDLKGGVAEVWPGSWSAEHVSIRR